MLHNWYKDTDGNRSTMRVMLFDFKKAFGLIDHAILMAKLGDYELPLRVLDWIADFLTDRKQRVKLAHLVFYSFCIFLYLVLSKHLYSP